MGQQTQQRIAFPRLDAKQLQWLAPHGEEMLFAQGDCIFAAGSPAENLYIVLEGEIRVTQTVGGEETLLVTHQPGEFTGEISLLTGDAQFASGFASSPTRVLRISSRVFRDLLGTCPEMTHIVLPALVQRVKEADGMVQRREKMAALGKLSAGLAHELNNPASAGRRAAQQMREALRHRQVKAFKLHAFGLSTEQYASLCTFAQGLEERPPQVPLDTLARSDREDEIVTWLEDHGVEEGWQLASTIVNAGLETSQLEALTANVPPAALGAAMGWLEATLTTLDLIDSIDKSTERISDLVQAIKDYTFMDQAALQEVDIHLSLENTIKILAYKLRHTDITIVRDYDRTLPTICAYGSELNQVWTNLIDNAADALAEQQTPRELRIHTALENDCVLIEITDNGPGIPAEIQSRIFDPFFTTKDVGKGTGLGLDTAYRIVVRRHHGDIRVESCPGATHFFVRLPVLQPGAEGKSSGINANSFTG